MIDFTSEPDKRTIHGWFEKGDYGTRGSIYDVETDAHTYTKGANETLPDPFYFSMILPEGETRAFLAFQRIGNRSIQTTFLEELKKSLQVLKSTYKLITGSVLTQSFIRDLLETGNIGEIRMIARHIPSDIARLFSDGYQDVSGTVELAVKARRGGRLPLNDQIMRVFRNQGMNVSDIFTFEDMNYEYEELKVQVTEAGKGWTIDLSDFNKIRPYYLMSKDIQRDEDGHPSVEAVHAFAMSLVDEYRQGAAAEIEAE